MGNLWLPLLKAIQLAEGLHKSMVFLSVSDLQEVLAFLDMLASLTVAASHLVDATGNDSLPPYPALGLAWMMHSLNRPYLTLSEIQSLHQLATWAALPSTAKLLHDSKVSIHLPTRPTGSSPVPLVSSAVMPSGLGIAPHPNVLIKPRPPVLLSQASIKDHPQKPRIIALAKTLFDSDTPQSRQSRSGKDYLCQVLKIVGSPPLTADQCSHSVTFTSAKGQTSHFAASTQELFDLPPLDAHPKPSWSQVAKNLPKASPEWQTVNCKSKPKSTIQGTKITMVIAAIPDNFRVPYPSLGVNGPELTEMCGMPCVLTLGQLIF